MMLKSQIGYACQGHKLATHSKHGSRVVVHQYSGKTEPFNENVAQVKRLISRDRKEFLGNSNDILDKYATEFGDGTAVEQPESVSSSSSNPFLSSSSTPAISSAAPVQPTGGVSSSPQKLDNPFKSSLPSSNPFGASSSAPPKPFKQSIEPKGLTPDMSPDPFMKETPFDLLKSIGLTQIFIVVSFSLIIGLMLATFYVVLNAGGIRLAGLD
ncbi:hypothetical protein CEUSTIGMA_g11056.t1 [Chlamydomonas eustigma]|uniref:Uncharacterized protein n=1 Tax=Chlamydomonas eustigma TaxID=1157962 RepID=A0A250XL63_9CHLO|nr:hypothetical protein CEUSTIGMA_g11056.t1 [Chlamydomonas eustigma]|eukprot:GAX83632.1 hypothetical protein CEUSTIGMA_g11056.t1 [Chlamydomonas eustigma]